METKAETVIRSQQQTAEAYYKSIIGDSRLYWAAPASFEAEELALEQQARAERRQAEALRTIQETSDEARPDPQQEEDVGHSSRGIGYQLLRKAGWKGSGGLGAKEQGIAAPLQAWNQGGRQGIGTFQTRKPTHDSKIQDGQQNAPKTLELAPPETAQKDGFQEARREQARKSRAPKREWQSVRVEEPLDKKVRRLQQVLQLEADEKAAKEIEQFVFRSFTDESGIDTNPLLRRHKLSASNPLA